MKFFNSVRFPVKGFGGLSLTSLSPVLIEVDSVAIVLRGYQCRFGFGFGSKSRWCTRCPRVRFILAEFLPSISSVSVRFKVSGFEVQGSFSQAKKSQAY